MPIPFFPSTKMPILCSGSPKMGVPKGKSAQKCRFCAREEGKVASGSVTVVWNAKPWLGLQNRGAKKQEGGLNLGHPLGWLRVCCGDRCNLASRQWGCWAAKLRNCEVRSRRGRNRWNRWNCCERCERCERCVRGSEGALVVLLQVLCYRVGDEGESIHVPSLRPVGVNLCRFLH